MARKPRKQRPEEVQVYLKPERKKNKQPIKDAASLAVLEHWNSKGIVAHRTDNQELARHLPEMMKRYEIDEVCQAIDNYATEYFDDSYVPWPGYKKYKHTLMSFMAFDKAVCRFMDDGAWWVKYVEYQERQKQIIIPENETSRDSGTKETSCISRTPEEALYFDCLTWLKTMPYKEYLESEHWQHFRKEAFKHFNGMCQLCGRTNETLELHHKTYINRGRETFNDVILLCTHCHELYHHNRDHCTCARCSGEEGQHEMLTM